MGAGGRRQRRKRPLTLDSACVVESDSASGAHALTSTRFVSSPPSTSPSPSPPAADGLACFSSRAFRSAFFLAFFSALRCFLAALRAATLTARRACAPPAAGASSPPLSRSWAPYSAISTLFFPMPSTVALEWRAGAWDAASLSSTSRVPCSGSAAPFPAGRGGAESAGEGVSGRERERPPRGARSSGETRCAGQPRAPCSTMDLY